MSALLSCVDIEDSNLERIPPLYLSDKSNSVLFKVIPVLWSPFSICVPSLVSRVNRSFFAGNITHYLSSKFGPNLMSIYYFIYLKLVGFSYVYVLSLCICDYFSCKLFSEFEFPYLKARYFLFFHRKEFRRKSIGRHLIESLNHNTRLNYLTVTLDMLGFAKHVIFNLKHLIFFPTISVHSNNFLNTLTYCVNNCHFR